jgi:UDP-N-acetylglucosamine 2-epimerase
MERILNIFNQLNQKVVFSIHPRTNKLIHSYGLKPFDYKNIIFIEPTSYLESLSYQNFSESIITDSGGMQKEAYMLEKKCITLRSETEWIETLDGGWNTLVYDNLEDIHKIIDLKPSKYMPNIYGNGKASNQIVKLI